MSEDSRMNEGNLHLSDYENELNQINFFKSNTNYSGAFYFTNEALASNTFENNSFIIHKGKL